MNGSGGVGVDRSGAKAVRWLLWVAALLLLVAVAIPAGAADTLTMDEYLGQVKGKNETVQGALEGAKAAHDRREEKDVAFAPTLFAEMRFTTDGKLPQLPFFTYERLNLHNYSLGVSKLTSFGLLTKLSYQLDYVSFNNAVFPGGIGGGGGPAIPLRFYDARPVLEASLPLWGNGFGRGAEAGRDLTEAQHAASEHASRFQARSALAQAEAVYWRLAVARESVAIGEEALDHSQKIYDWTLRRAKMNLGERADELQARAAFQLARLSLKQAQDEVKGAQRAFNATRNVDAPEVLEQLPRLSTLDLRGLPVPKRAAVRDDVEAARQQTKATSAAATLAVEKYKPSLDLYGSFALNGRDANIGGSLGSSYSTNPLRPTATVGVKFQMPLDFGATEAARRGASLERVAAEKTLRQRELDQESSWRDLSYRLEEAKERLELSETIEEAQEAKVDNERQRLRNGRTTTYQVLLFEQDFAQAQLARLRAQADLLSVVTQMRLFSAEEI